jgi:hypothetical protein
MRSIKELLELMLDNVNMIGHSKTKSGGLCSAAYRLHLKYKLTIAEFNLCIDYFKKNKPQGTSSNHYYWPVSEKEPRKAWLLEQIKIINLSEVKIKQD